MNQGKTYEQNNYEGLASMSATEPCRRYFVTARFILVFFKL